jgi:hypothetical protein
MNEKLFVGLTFRSDDILSKKVTGFRKRFDPNFTKASFPHMSLLAPFEINSKDLVRVKEELQEELDTFFFGQDSPLKLSFTGVNFVQTKKHNILYLNPNFSADLEHCMELIQDIAISHIPRNVKYKPNPKQFLPLGCFKEDDPLAEVMDAIRSEFEENSDLTITGISLFRKKHGVWSAEEKLVSFQGTKESVLQFQRA